MVAEIVRRALPNSQEESEEAMMTAALPHLSGMKKESFQINLEDPLARIYFIRICAVLANIAQIQQREEFYDAVCGFLADPNLRVVFEAITVLSTTIPFKPLTSFSAQSNIQSDIIIPILAEDVFQKLATHHMPTSQMQSLDSLQVQQPHLPTNFF
jgi:hypothetical protein